MDPTDLALADLALLASLLLATGVVAGTLAGLLGIGGGIVIVPVLFHLFGWLGIDDSVRMHLAVGTSLSTIIATALRSAYSHHRRGAVDVELLRAWALPALAGVVLAAWIAGRSSGRVLEGIFGVVALSVAFHMALGKETWRLAATPPTGAAGAALAFGVGGLSVLMGLGAGTLGVPTLTLLGAPIHRAVGTAAGLGVLIAVPGTLGFAWAGLGAPGRPPLSLGYVNLIGFALIVPATVLTAPLGARFAHSIGRTTLRRAFALFLSLTSLRMLHDLLG